VVRERSGVEARPLEVERQEMNWYPAHLKHGRYEKTLESAPDWNISRNRYWGNPIPIWKCESCVVIVSHGDPIWTMLQHFKKDGYPGFAEINEIKVDIPDLHRPYIDEVVLKCEKCGGDARRVPEIFDSWVEAGSMPFAEYHYPFENKDFPKKNYPADFVAEYIAQTRAWFYVMHVVGLEIFDAAPFRNVVTTGTILAEDGSKMSKSKNNYPDPWIVINKYGVDSLRFYLMGSSVMQADNLNFSVKDLETAHRKVTMLLWNVYQYFLTYAAEAGWHEKKFKLFQGSSKNVLDRWIKARTKELVLEVSAGFDGYDTVRAARAIESFVDDLSTWYLRRSRGRTEGEFFTSFYEVLRTALKVIAPFMPHLSEAMYMNLMENFGGGAESVHLAAWPEKEELTAEEQKLLKDMVIIRSAASTGLHWRKSKDTPVRQPLPMVGIGLNEGVEFDLTPELAEVLKGEINVKEVIKGRIPGLDAPAWPGMGVINYLHVDNRLTDELRLEGLTRALERFVQEMRKTAGMKVGEKAVLTYETSDPDIEKALATFNREKTYISGIEKGSPDGGDLSAVVSAKAGIFEADGKSGKFSLKGA
jgi:isoleucyl-tRNA synthetase